MLSMDIEAMKTIRLLVLAAVLCAIASCQGNRNDKQSTHLDTDLDEAIAEEGVATSNVEIPRGAEVLFDDFLYCFSKSEPLQRHRIKFPLEVNEGNSQQLIADSAWVMEPFFFNDGEYTLLFNDTTQMALPADTAVNMAVVEKFFLQADSVCRYHFCREEGRWMLTTMSTQRVADNANAAFLHFYQRFTADSAFRQHSLAHQIEFAGPDPDDEFEQMEGFITPDSWEAFAPLLPQDSLYNIVYGQQPEEQSRQKILVIRGIDDEQDIVMTFQLTRGRWLLTRLTE